MEVVIIDDKNPRINYTTGWYNADGGHSTDYNQTTTISGGSNAGFHFTFNGTSISVYGSVAPNNTALSTYTIDTATPLIFVNPNLTQYTSGQLMYQSPQLEDGLHTLSVSAPNTTIGVPSTQFAFDYLTYVPSPSSSNSTSSPPATSSQSGQSQSSNLHVTLPAVLVPTLVCIALLVIALLIQRRRSTDYRRSSEERMEKLASASQIDSAGLPMLPSAAHIPLPESDVGTSDFGDDMSFRPSTLPRSSFTSRMTELPGAGPLTRAPASLLPTRSVTPDPMVETTRARRLQRFNTRGAPSAFPRGAGSVFSAQSIDTADVPPTYRSTTSVRAP